ncbi:MAG: DNA-processing protein DprA [Mariprofundaceae bacterium]|nr:DNA-processing protein DprA [Mariprofundaceae bacterium]
MSHNMNESLSFVANNPTSSALAALRLSLAHGIGTHIAKQLIETCGSIEAIWQHNAETWANIPRVGPKLLAALETARHQSLDNILQTCQEYHLHLIGMEDDVYPTLLREIDDAPLILFVQGNLEALQHKHCLAMVGSRKSSQESKLIARRWSQYFSDLGISIISGMAYGIDAAAHRGALQGNTPTIAILGCGLATLQHRQQEQVAAIIEHGGCVISEYLPTQTARPEFFPRRNRIIAGMSQGTIIVEADIRSGSLITARLANEYGRDVFAVPGSVLHDGHAGCHQLIRDGAALLTDDVEHIIQHLAWQLQSTPKTIIQGENELEKQIITALQRETLHLDALSESCGLTVPQLSPILLALELQGVIERLPGSRYTLGG